MVKTAVLVWAVLGMWSFAKALAGEPATDQVWLVSTRQAPWLDDGATLAAPGYWRLSPQRQWMPATEQQFLACDNPAVPTVFYIHGNRAEVTAAVNDGWRLRELLQGLAPGRPLRYVIWSWPADRLPGSNRLDVRVKAARSDTESRYLAQLLARINPQVPISFFGYSFGARIITGAMHLLAAGEAPVQGALYADPGIRRLPMRAVLVAAAEDCDWLLPERCHGLALSQADRILITVNPADPVLKRYPLMYGRRGPEALGYVGPPPGAHLAKLEPLNLACSVGKSHDWECYLADPALRARLAWYTFLAPSASESPARGRVPAQTPGPAKMPPDPAYSATWSGRPTAPLAAREAPPLAPPEH